MHVRVRLDGARSRRWHTGLLQRISDTPGVEAVSVDIATGPKGWPSSADLLFRLEALVYGLNLGGSLNLPPADLAAWARPMAADLVLDLCGDAVAACPVWRPAYDGGIGENGLLMSLLAGRVPQLELIQDERVVASGILGTDHRGSIAISFEDALARTTTVITAALTNRLSGRPEEGIRADLVQCVAPALPARALGRRSARLLARNVASRLYRLCYNAPHWRTGWRRLDGPDLFDLGRHPDTGWNTLLDDARRFYADPFPLAFAGSTHVFVEEFPHATGKAIISAVRFGPDGPEGTPVPVLEEPHHLSYPFVFERDGEAWMVPESSAAGTVDLYRATRFPGGWVKEATLLSGVVASDATLVEHAGHWWIFATVRDAGPSAPLGSGSYHDALHIWSAPDFRGPYTAHPGNPVLIDPSTARPAGRIVERGGHLIRPVQDCSQGYGRALGLARIDRLDPDGFAQTIVSRITPGPAWPGNCLHTLNAGGGIECIDGSARASRIKAMIGGRVRQTSAAALASS
ncbi:formyl transferase [Methylobacterium sp. J-072]|uniref:glucosamine inositolphosphorylceramide transferase family protein n=2 Tax=unclassified Methylobacterium TaxID=2615210 RepID=UPI001FBA9FD6|nr:formyl transferase [Methylobacterium sp. J-072]MCJ2094962.1 formyl transferase [Methylobacterium sp. J-072]